MHGDPWIIGDEGAEALLESLDRVWDPEESGDSLVRSGYRGWNPEVSVVVIGPENRIGPLRPCRNPKVWIRRSLFGTRRSLFGTRRFFEVVMTPMRPRLHRGTVLRLPRKDYYRYLFGFRILPLGSWPLSSSYVVFYFCRKSLTGLEGAGVARGVLIQVLFTLVLWGPRCPLGCTGVFGSFDSMLRLAHTHSCFMSHTRFDSLWVCHCGRSTFVRVGQDRRSLET
ncbi:hypothetical protein F2Q70_00003717 [Brassica cretica]|uniref:Uncharacterized protein n=1 Tax=Brassica cretica TaxID=69181 RepID=A0A8S9J455_BRACR|nr:hypothetical protein F2Q70_00003717 [Brassica cretica]